MQLLHSEMLNSLLDERAGEHGSSIQRRASYNNDNDNDNDDNNLKITYSMDLHE